MGLIHDEKHPATNSTCERCGQAFYCGASLLGCWCVDVKLSAEAREHLRRHYHGCLCRDCLAHFSGPEETWKTQT